MAKHKTRKDRRKDYTGSKVFDSSCRCNGGCPWCKGNRTYQDSRERAAADEQIDFYERSRTVNPLEQGHPGWY